MTLVKLHVDLARVADALERIAFLLEKLVIAPPPADLKATQATLDDLHIVAPEDIERMTEDRMRFAEIHRVVPGSEAFAQELLAWEADQRSRHGEDWQAPDWAEIFAAAYSGSRTVREPAGATSAAAERSQAAEDETVAR